MQPRQALGAVGGGAPLAAGVMGYLMRAGVTRYLRMRRMGNNPSLVGASVTPQGNERAPGKSAC